MKHLHKNLWLFLMATMLACASALTPAQADQKVPQKVDQKAIEAVGGNTFASEHVVLQATNKDPVRQNLVINVANNLIKAYGPDNVDIEIVAFGPGITLLFANNKQAERIQSLAAQGVRFSACENSLRHVTKKLGHEPKLNPAAKKVPAGIVRVLNLVNAGYTLVRP